MTTKVTGSVLANTAVTAGTYGGSTQHAVVTVDAQGRLTLAANATPSIANSQITGVMTGSQLAATAVTPATYGGISVIPSFTVDQQGRMTFAGNNTPSIANSQITGVMTGSQLAATAVTPATYGGSTQHSVVTVDQQGRVTFAANATPSIANSQITGVMTASQLAATAVTTGTYGGAATSAVITVDQQGRVTAAANATISAGGFSNMVVITSTNASYSIPATKIKVTVVGGGGVGGAIVMNGLSFSAGGGGGAGGVAVKTLSGLTIGNTLNITIGASAGSTTVASGTQTITTITGGAGSAGSTVTWGNEGQIAGTISGGAGGTATNGDLNITGGRGVNGFYVGFGGCGGSVPKGYGGTGGQNAFGVGGLGGLTANRSLGAAGSLYGGGGGGSYDQVAGANAAGGAGAAGVVIVEY